MSTKFNNAQNLQPTPKVCKKGPEGWKYDYFTFKDYPLQAYASWSQPITPWHFNESGQTTLNAYPAENLHAGLIGDYYHTLEVDLIWWPIPQQFQLVLNLVKQNIISNTHEWWFSEPTPSNPFEAGLFTFEYTVPLNEFYCECRIFS